MSKLRFEVDPQNSLLLHLFWEEELLKTVFKQLFIRKLSLFRDCQEKEELLVKFCELEAKIARAEGVRLLARRGYFGPELKQKLRLKHLSEGAIDTAVAYLEEKGYIQDTSRAECVAKRELEKGHGPQYIYQMLKHKKISSDELARIKPWLESQEKQSLQAYLKRRPGKEKKKLIAQLLRRGYSYEAIQSVLQQSIWH